jgi:transposase
MKAWIFTPVVSRYRFVYPVERETTETAIEACEAAWDFYGGVFAVVIPDNTSAIITRADPLGAAIHTAFLEYSQSRGFVIDPARVRRAKDKARV